MLRKGLSFYSTQRNVVSIPWCNALLLKRLVLHEPEVEEQFIKGSGKGGQKINKVRNCVALKHTPTGIIIQCQHTRSLENNRRIGRKRLLEKLDEIMNGTKSQKNIKIAKVQRKKAAKSAKSRKKYTTKTSDDSDNDDEEGSIEDENQSKDEQARDDENNVRPI